MSQFSYPNPVSPAQRAAPRPSAPAAAKTIPFDYVFQFSLLGQRGNKVQDVVEISTVGVFVSLSVGYSLVLDERKTPRTFGPIIDQNTLLRAPSFVPILSNGTLNQLFINGVPGAEVVVVILDSPQGVIFLRPQAVIADGLIDNLPRIIPGGTIGPDGTLLLVLKSADVISPGSRLLLWDRTNNLF